MIFENYLLPDKYFDSFDKITTDELSSTGVRLVICDVDNTLAPYEMAKPDERIIKWIKSIQEANICIVLISNNKDERLSLFNEDLKLRVYKNANKPSRKAFFAAMNEFNCDVNNTLVIGDQLLTDVLAAKRVGCKAYLVPPIKDKKTMLFRLKRII